MSASSKKKLRAEENAAKLTEKQLSERKEAKKLRIYTIAFGVVLAVMIVAFIWVGVSQTITNAGVREKKTVALTIGEHKINSVEMNYFYVDSINNFYSQYGSYAAMFGLDTTVPWISRFWTRKPDGPGPMISWNPPRALPRAPMLPRTPRKLPASLCLKKPRTSWISIAPVWIPTPRSTASPMPMPT